ncbi:MAG: sulfotransferase family protein [Acidimicrobiia bacterium]
MTLQVVGAGLGRTGTMSLKGALEQLLGGPCYHMMEVFGKPDVAETWKRAAEGDFPDWDVFLADYRAAVDWPAAAFWRELSEAYPDAIILLSTRDVDGWWKSASNTIFQVILAEPEPGTPLDTERQMIFTMLEHRFTPEWQDPDAAKAAYVRHNDDVRATAPAERLVEWHPGDGWGPLCAALDLPVPDEPFPHMNSTADFRQMVGLDGPG